MDTKTLDMAYLEYSQITKARTRREIQAKQIIEHLLDLIDNATTEALLSDSHLSVSKAKKFVKSFDQN